MSFRQYIPNKKHKYGEDIQVYTGRDEVPESVVLELAEPLLNIGRTAYTDNFYTSVSLATKLNMKETHLVGTLRANRKYNSPEVVAAKLTRGDRIVRESSNGILELKWKDKRDVMVLSTKHNDDMVEIAKRGGTIVKPKTIVDYNQGKTFIDLSDPMSSYSCYLRRTIKWYRRLILKLLLGTCVANGLVVYNTMNPTSIMDIVTFRKKIAEYLIYGRTTSTLDFYRAQAREGSRFAVDV